LVRGWQATGVGLAVVGGTGRVVATGTGLVVGGVVTTGRLVVGGVVGTAVPGGATVVTVVAAVVVVGDTVDIGVVFFAFEQAATERTTRTMITSLATKDQRRRHKGGLEEGGAVWSLTRRTLAVGHADLRINSRRAGVKNLWGTAPPWRILLRTLGSL
jgi:hypothetical protein